MSSKRRRNKRKNKSTKPDIPSYASRLKSNDAPVQPTLIDTDNADEYNGFVYTPPIERRCVTNYTPPHGNSSHNAWERAYFTHLVELRNIFISGMSSFISPTDREYMRSTEFFENFSQFIYDSSSKYISPYMENMTEEQEDEYFKYTVMKNVN